MNDSDLNLVVLKYPTTLKEHWEPICGCKNGTTTINVYEHTRSGLLCSVLSTPGENPKVVDGILTEELNIFEDNLIRVSKEIRHSGNHFFLYRKPLTNDVWLSISKYDGEEPYTTVIDMVDILLEAQPTSVHIQVETAPSWENFILISKAKGSVLN